MHKKRFAERGFNQSEKIAQHFCIENDIILQTDLLVRNRNTYQQAKLTRAERLVNLNRAFDVKLDKNLPSNIILFDDVLTTGATFREAADALKKAGVEKVVCLAVCHG